MDTFDNQPGLEALYVRSLDIGPSSYLDLNGLNLYYLDGTIDPTATIVGGSVTLVPEPATVLMLLSGGLCLLACVFRHPRARRRLGND